jgi:hypothetical protein
VSSVAPRNPADVLEIFLAKSEDESLRANTAAIASSLVSMKEMPDCDQKTEIMNYAYAGLAANIKKLSCSAFTASPAPPLPPPREELVCSICMENIEYIPARTTYVDATFTRCGHGFHILCLLSHRQIGAQGFQDKCPVCRQRLGSFDQPEEYGDWRL